ncbi:hypothetical protein OG455_27875 [Kitasatospora sp. NBC_01287]|uniref:hypothetical protein n=1 Tax=Kitasatospora sp. NBC_01287 TaxID=2903573 RepID=UPI002252C9DB|nr:hypothetical protein [Kitasatospora sp. NBC_01287]MCX4749281.1 hypothetical protein [Kitasatospora sp. NBC_01287]
MYAAVINELAEWLAKDTCSTAKVTVDGDTLILTPSSRGKVWDVEIHMTVTARPGHWNGNIIAFTCIGHTGSVLYGSNPTFKHRGFEDAARQLRHALVYFRTFGHESDPDYWAE